MLNLRNLFKKEKNPVKVEAGRLGGIRSGEARRLKKMEKKIVNDIFNKIPELTIVRSIGKYFDIELSDKELIAIIPYLEAIRKKINENEETKPWDF